MARFHKLKKSGKIGKAALSKYLLYSYFLIFFTVIFFAQKSYDSYLERELMKMESSAYEIEAKFTYTLDYSESVLNHISRKITNSGGQKNKIAQILKSFNSSESEFASVQDLLSTGMFFWIDANEMLIMSSEYGLVKMPIDVSKRDYLAQTKKNPWKIFSGTPAIGAASRQFVIPAGVGVTDEKGEYLGTIAVGFKVEELIRKFSKFSKLNQTEFSVLDFNNKILMESSESFFSQNKNLLKALEKVDNKSQTVVDYNFFSSEDNYVILRVFEKYPYRVLVARDAKILKSGSWQEILPHLIELLIITIFFATIFYFVRTVLKH